MPERRPLLQQVTEENWAVPDPIMGYFGSLHAPVDGLELVRQFLTPKLHHSVPDEVRAMFEAARGAFCYGYFFYPLYTLATEQLYRVVEAGLRHRCGKADPNKRPIFHQLIDQATKDGLIDTDLRERLHLIRQIRNATSHAADQYILQPNDAIGTLTDVAAILNTLFP